MPDESDKQILSGFEEAIIHPRQGEIVRPVYTLPLHEFRLRDYCRENGIACYLPLRKVWRVLRRSYGDRQYEYPRVAYKPMFPSYVFVRLNEAQRTRIFLSNSVLRIIRPENPDEGVLLREIERDNFHGIGKPEPLKKIPERGSLPGKSAGLTVVMTALLELRPSLPW